MENEKIITENNSENSQNINENNVEKVNYNTFSKNELIEEFEKLLLEKDILSKKNTFETIKAVFYKKQHDEIAELSKKFIDDGNEEKDFNYELDESDKKIKDLLNKYKTLRTNQLNKLEEQKEINYNQKLLIIDEINNLINTQESLNTTFEHFKNLQAKWKEITLLPQKKIKELWRAYNLAIDKFYDYIKINNELKNYDLKKNLEAKLELIENAKALNNEKNIIEAFKSLQHLHDEWREIGPVPLDQKEIIWEQFKEATSVINKKHAQYFKDLKAQQNENLIKKTKICERIEEINSSLQETQKLNEKLTNEVKSLQEKWRTIGMVDKKENDKIYERFKTATNIYFDKRKEHFNEIKEIQLENLSKKIKICEKAEELSVNNEWKETTKKIINLQKQWKEIGNVPRKDSDKTWKRFRKACDEFFKRKEENFKGKIEEQEENLNKKQEIIKTLLGFAKSDDPKKDIEILKEIQKQWNAIGYTPIKNKNEVNESFYSLINKAFDDIKIEKTKAELIKFELKIEAIISQSKSKFDNEKIKLQNQISKIKSEILQLENNIGFFAKGSNKYIDEINKNIEKKNQSVVLLNKKLNIIKNIEKKIKSN